MGNRKGLPVWIPPNKVCFSKAQMIAFLLPNLFELREGEYPPEPDEYYIVLPRLGEVYCKKGVYEDDHQRKSYQAPFIIAVEIGAEIDKRLSMSPYGHWIISRYTYGNSIDQIAATSRLSPMTVAQQMRTALQYISGWKRKPVPQEQYYRDGWYLVDRILALLH